MLPFKSIIDIKKTAYHELLAQGWIQTRGRAGTFVHDSSPTNCQVSTPSELAKSIVNSIKDFSKTIASSFRLGFVVADPSGIQQMAGMRRYIDRRGDPVLECATAPLFKFGEIRRPLNKDLRLYKKT